MFKIILTALSCLTLGLLAGPNIFDECIDSCEKVYEACSEKSGPCSFFENYLINSDLVDSFNTSEQFLEFAALYCFDAMINGTAVVCDVYVRDIIDCIAYSPCWIPEISTTFNPLCEYYAVVNMNVEVLSYFNEVDMCLAPWETYFGIMFGETISTSVEFLYGNCSFSTSDIDFKELDDVNNHVDSAININFELTYYFYSELEYLEFIALLDEATMSAIFATHNWYNDTSIIVSNFNTECCPLTNPVPGLGEVDVICLPPPYSTTGILISTQETTVAESYSSTVESTEASTGSTTTSSSGNKSDAVSNKPFIFNFIIVSAIVIISCIF